MQIGKMAVTSGIFPCPLMLPVMKTDSRLLENGSQQQQMLDNASSKESQQQA
jgi:hypothetical protein